jgi:hypothetical protein
MGLEMSIPDFHMTEAEALLPPWVNRDVLHCDVGDDAPKPSQRGLDDPARKMMPFTFVVCGLQHLTNNINADVRQSLVYWEVFWQQLENFSGFLLCGERRRRFTWTCVTGTPWASQAYRLNKWSQTLCEKRWRTIPIFLKRLLPLLPLFRGYWDERKYARGVDDPGLVRDGGEDAAGPEDADNQGYAQFDPAELTKTLKDPFFNVYVSFALAAERVPDEHLGRELRMSRTFVLDCRPWGQKAAAW